MIALQLNVYSLAADQHDCAVVHESAPLLATEEDGNRQQRGTWLQKLMNHARL